MTLLLSLNDKVIATSLTCVYYSMQYITESMYFILYTFKIEYIEKMTVQDQVLYKNLLGKCKVFEHLIEFGLQYVNNKHAFRKGILCIKAKRMVEWCKSR